MIDDRTSNLNLPLPHPDNTLEDDVLRLRSALSSVDTAVAGRQATSAKGAANGYAPLDAQGKVPAANLPSYVDDVLEVANYAALPATGETGKIYVTLDNGRTYRWGGSAYAQIVASPGTTDDVTEGSTNLYFTPARARAAQIPATETTPGVVKVGNGLSVDVEGTVSVDNNSLAFGDLSLTIITNGQTMFTVPGGYTVGAIDLYLNGVRLVGQGDDYTATNGTSLTLSAGVNTTDTLVIKKWNTFSVAESLPKAGGAMSGALQLAGDPLNDLDAAPKRYVDVPRPIMRSARTGNTKIAVADKGKLIDITSGTFEQEFDTPSELGAGWWCYLRNSGAGDIGMPTVLGTEVVSNGNVDQYGANVVVNGGFDADTNWTKGAGWTISGGKAVATATTGNLTAAVAPLVSGTMYRVTFDCTVTSGTFQVLLGSLSTDVISASGTYTVYGTANSTALVVDGVSAFTGTIDNIVVQPLTGWQFQSATSQAKPAASSFVLTAYAANPSAAWSLGAAIPAMTAGAVYDVTYTVTRTAGDIRISFQDAQDLTTRSASGTYTERIVASAAHTQLHFEYVTGAFTGTISAISIKKVTGAIDSDDGDGLFVMYPGEARLVQSDGSALRTVVLNAYSKEFALSGAFLKPTRYAAHHVEAWGGGGNGANINGAFVGPTGGGAISGGSGGGYAYSTYLSSTIGVAENVVVGGPAGSSTFKNTVAGGGVSATTLVSAAPAGGTSDGLTSSFFNGAATNSPNSAFGGAAAGYTAPNEGSGLVYVTNWPTLPTGWSYSSSTLTKDSATAQNAAAGSIAVTAGNLCFFQFSTTSSGGTGNRYYTITLSGAVSKTFSVSSNASQYNAQLGYFIAASGTLNISVSGPDITGTGNHNFTVAVKNTPAFTGSIPGGTSKYAGNGGSYSTTNESATMGGFPGGGGAAYASAGGGNWGRGGSGCVRIRGVS